MSKVEGHKPESEYLEANEAVSTEWSIHPGLVLKHEVMAKKGVTATALADAIEVARPGLNNMLNGKRAITASLALKIEAAIGYPADMLLRLQAAHDLSEAKHNSDMAALVEKISETARMTFTSLVANENSSVRIRKLA